MILNTQSVELVRSNALRLATSIRSKDDLAELATASNYEQVLYAIESLLTNTEMFFDDEILTLLDDNSWRSFKALLMVYTLNLVNRNTRTMANSQTTEHNDYNRGFLGATAQA